MRQVLFACAMLVAVTAHAERFRPFVDEVGVTPDGVIVTTTTATGQSDAPTPTRHELKVYSAFGDLALLIDAEGARRARQPVSKARWRSIDHWIGSLKASRISLRPLEEVKCRTRPDPADPAAATCPATMGLVRTPTGLGLWSSGSPIWAWGEPRVAELEHACVVVLPDNSGSLDRYRSEVWTCPPRLP